MRTSCGCVQLRRLVKTMIPEFPNFVGLTPELSDAVEERTKHFPYYSDFNFSSLWSWDTENKRQVSILNNNLVVKFTDYETGDIFYSFLGMNETLKTTLTLLELSESQGLVPELRLMPEISVHDIDSPLLEVTVDRDNFDYVYLLPQLCEMKGGQFKSKRQSADHFSKKYDSVEFQVWDVSVTKTQEVIHKILQSWSKRRPTEDDQSIDHEAKAIDCIMKLAGKRSIFAGVVLTNGKPTAFTIEEIVNGIFSISHFWKTANHSQGEYEFLAREMARYLFNKEVMYWNWEQDLGIESLRNSKTSFRPSDFLKKFKVARRTVKPSH